MTGLSVARTRFLWGSGLLASVPSVFLFSVWNKVFAGRPGLSLLLTFMTWLWVAALFVSAAALWRSQGPRFFGLASYVACLSTALSGFWLLVFYPAVMSHDSLVHWQEALANRYSSWSPPLLPMIMRATQFVGKTPALFSFIQGSLFWASLFFLVHQVSRNRRWFLAHSSLMALLPPLWLYSNAAISTTWGALFLMLAMGFLIQAVRSRKEKSLFLSVGALSLAFVFRKEALLCLVVPLAVYLVCFKKSSGWARKAMVSAGLVLLAVLPGLLIERSPNVVRAHRSQVHGVFNQYVGTVVLSMGRLSRAEVDVERRSIDAEFGRGVFRKLIRRYDCRSGDYIIYDRQFPRVLKRIPKTKNFFIFKKVIGTAIRHPLAYLQHQACYFGWLSQFSAISYQSWGVLRKEPQYEAERARLGIPYDSQLPAVKAGYARLMKASLKSPVFSLLYRHYIFLVLLAVSLAAGFLKRRSEWIIPSSFGLVHVLGYLAAGPAGLWRYLLPSYLAAWACLPSVLASIFRPGRKAGRRSPHDQRPADPESQ